MVREKTESKILELLGDKIERDAGEIADTINLGYDTISRHLKDMYEIDKLVRKPKGNAINSHTKRKHWRYYYNIK